MSEQATICVAYKGEAVNDGTMDVNELAPALLALSNFIDEANRTLNNDGSKIEVRVSAHFERGSFEMVLNLVRTLAQQIKLFFGESSYSLGQMLNELGLASTLSGINLLDLYRRLKGRQPKKVEKVNENTVRVIFEEESHEVSIGVWRLFKSEKMKKHIEGVVHPLKSEGVDALEFRDADNKETVGKIVKDEVEYFADLSEGEELQEFISTQQLILRIVNLSFERGLKWRFDDGESKFYAEVKDEKFLEAIDEGRISFGSGDVILAEIETKQQYSSGELRKSIKTITKVFRISRREGQHDFSSEES